MAAGAETKTAQMNAYEFADMVVKGVSFHFSYAEELWDDDGIIIETELC